ncbi:MAG: hypothetical protein K2J78_00955 [Muribaculaceae bacterium]|nr:hypothetical protein [Muribaculaceae bacterium]
MEFIIKLETECKENRNTHRFTIQYYVYEQDGRYIAYCPALDMTSTGDDLNDVITQFYEHFQLYVECCIEDNTLLDDLKAHGWKLNGVTITQPTFNELLMKQEFKYLLESNTQYKRRNAIFQFQL